MTDTTTIESDWQQVAAAYRAHWDNELRDLGWSTAFQLRYHTLAAKFEKAHGVSWREAKPDEFRDLDRRCNPLAG